MIKTCAICESEFEPLRKNRLTCSDACRREHERRHRQAYDASPERQAIRSARRQGATRPPLSPRNCKRCEAPFSPSHGLQVYCGNRCKSRHAEDNRPKRPRADRPPPQPLRVTCEHCNGPIAQPAPKRKFCGGSCRKASHMAKFESTALDYEGEIAVADLEESPRRLALAKLLDRFDGTQYFDHGATRPAWINPNDKRASR
jgi:hypothetical protein